MTDGDLLELAAAYGVSWGTEADTGRPRVLYCVGTSAQVIDIEIIPGESEIRPDHLDATRRAIAVAVADIPIARH